MPTKRNWAGNQQEYYPAGNGDKSGEYAAGSGHGGQVFNQPTKSPIDSTINDILTEKASINELPEEHQKTKTYDEASFNKLKDSVKVVGKDGKTYSYNEGFIKDWVNGVQEKAKHPTFNEEKGDFGGMSNERVNFDKQEIQNEINKQAESLKANGSQPKYERKATFVFGLPAAGKSMLSEPLKNDMGAFEIDADLMKQHIPEFQDDPQMVSAVHEESSWMSKDMFNQLKDKGANLVIGKVGGEKNYNSILKMMTKLKEQGYEIDIQVAHKDLKKALEANLGRFINRYNDKANWKKKPPRIVDTGQHKDTQKTYFDTAIRFFNEGYANGFKFIDVNGKEPKVIKEKRR